MSIHVCCLWEFLGFLTGHEHASSSAPWPTITALEHLTFSVALIPYSSNPSLQSTRSRGSPPLSGRDGAHDGRRRHPPANDSHLDCRPAPDSDKFQFSCTDGYRSGGLQTRTGHLFSKIPQCGIRPAPTGRRIALAKAAVNHWAQVNQSSKSTALPRRRRHP